MQQTLLNTVVSVNNSVILKSLTRSELHVEAELKSDSRRSSLSAKWAPETQERAREAPGNHAE